MILSKADIQAYAPELDLSSYTDATISGMLLIAEKRAAQFASVAGFDLQAVTNETSRAFINNDGELVISVKRRPIVSVTSISLQKGGFSTSLNLTDTNGTQLFQIPDERHKLVFPNSYFYLTGTYLAGGSSQLLTLRGAKTFYNMSYVGGYQNPPEDLKYAIMLYFRDALAKRGAISTTTGAQISSFSQGSYSETYNNSSNASGQSSYVKEAEGVLMNGGYVRMEF